MSTIIADTLSSLTGGSSTGVNTLTRYSGGQLEYWNGTAWTALPVSGSASVGTTAPTSPATGALWYDTNPPATLKTWDGTAWVNSSGVVAANSGGTGLTASGTSGNVLVSDGTTWTSTAIGATAAETIAGTVTDKYISPDDLKATLGVGANYTISINTTGSTNPALTVQNYTNPTVGTFYGSASSNFSYVLYGTLANGTASATTIGYNSCVVGQVVSVVDTTQNSSGLLGENNSASGGGTKYGVIGRSGGATGTNIGVYGTAGGGATNWGGYFDSIRVFSGEAQFDGAFTIGTGVPYTGAVAKIYNITQCLELSVSDGGGAGQGLAINRTSSDGIFIAFARGGAYQGAIQSDGLGGVNYASASDYRLKENVQPMTGALAKIALLKPSTYTWKVNGANGQGFIAHELQAVCPEAVSGEKDAVNEDGSIKPQGIDQSKLVATLVAAMQEQQAMIEELRARISALESK